MNPRHIYIVVVAFLLGSLLVIQSKSFEGVENSLMRDIQSNVFQEIQIINQKNDDLQKEISNLEKTYEQISNQGLALDAIEEEIEKYKKLSGKFAVFGPGLEIKLEGKINTAWMVDLVNEFYNTGAEAVGVNNIRLVNHTMGFDTTPNDQILLNGSVLSEPHTFQVLGESSVLLEALEMPGGIFERLKSNFPELEIKVETIEIIKLH
ncbi:DUF881 domain-containing protein [Patescibacteria group bacterium]